jgi:hypothetical protein
MAPAMTSKRLELPAHAFPAPEAMPPSKFRESLSTLAMSPYKAGPLLGISRSLAYRYARGVQPVNRTVALLLAAMVREHGRAKRKTPHAR